MQKHLHGWLYPRCHHMGCYSSNYAKFMLLEKNNTKEMTLFPADVSNSYQSLVFMLHLCLCCFPCPLPV